MCECVCVVWVCEFVCVCCVCVLCACVFVLCDYAACVSVCVLCGCVSLCMCVCICMHLLTIQHILTGMNGNALTDRQNCENIVCRGPHPHQHYPLRLARPIIDATSVCLAPLCFVYSRSAHSRSTFVLQMVKCGHLCLSCGVHSMCVCPFV